MPQYKELPNYIQRRVGFLRTEAILDSPRDQIITYTMRVLSNYASVGLDGGSTLIKRKNKIISRGALDKLHNSRSILEWAEQCINEHPTPLKLTWQWIKSHAQVIDDEAVWLHFVENRMVTISREEDVKLSQLGLRSTGESIERYKKADIKIEILNKEPETLFQDL